MNIGSVFFDLHGNGGPLQVDAQKAAEAAAGVSGRAFTATFHQSLKQSILQGVGLGAGIGGFNLLSTAIEKTVGFLGDVVGAGMEEEASISRLGTSLRANVPNWDGNTAAIERTFTAYQRLGFSDEQMRNSMAVLVGATHDVAKAQHIQAIAADLARFKNIDLQTASEALIKVEAGVYRSLKSLGIQLRDGATQTEAFAAVEAVAKGQAEEFANTTSGKLLAAQTVFGEKMDELGARTLPVVSQALMFLNDQMDTTPGHQNVVEKSFQGWGQAIDYVDMHMTHFATGGIAMAKGSIERLPVVIQKATPQTALASSRLADSMSGPIVHAGEYAKGMWGRLLDDTVAKFQSTWDELRKIADGTAETVFGKQTRAAKLLANARDQTAERAILASHKSTAAEKADARNRLLALQQEGLGIRIEMAGRGELSKKAYGQLVKDLQRLSKSGSKEVADAARQALAELAKLKAAALAVPQLNWGGAPPSKGPTKTASGGSRSAGQLLMVGEKGPELWVPETNGTMVPNDQLHVVPAGSAGGDTYQISVPVQGLLRATDPMEVATTIRRVARLGLISAKPVYG